MHPIEHFLYYSCAWLLPLVFTVHPMHFLSARRRLRARSGARRPRRRYAKYHADISPIGGHDGIDEPSCKGDFHWLHHSKREAASDGGGESEIVGRRFECNYGVPFPFNFDKLFGTWVEYEDFKANGGKLPKANADKISGLREGAVKNGKAD